MSLNVHDLSAGLFVRGLTNLKTQLTKAEAHAAANGSGEAALLDAQDELSSDRVREQPLAAQRQRLGGNARFD